MRTVRIEWEGPLSLDEVKELSDEDDYGLYQIYGTHIVYGANVLLYIGKAEGLTFSQRLSQHREWLSEEEGVSIRIGRISEEDYDHDPPDWSDWREVLRDAEALTIHWHSPAYNSSNIETYNGQQLTVVNRGERGDLCARLSVAEDSSLVTVKYFLKVLECEDDPDDVVKIILSDDDHNSVVQSDVFEVTGKKRLIVQAARNKALNNVRREDLRSLFEKQRWQESYLSIFVRGHISWRVHVGEKGYIAVIVIGEVPEDAKITL